jgi:protein TonB
MMPARADPDLAPAFLSTVDHHGDLPPVGVLKDGPDVSTSDTKEPQVSARPVIHDFSMEGLAVLHRVDPIYPELARRARLQGPVVLLMTVDERGLPIQVQVLEGAPAFHEAALQAARQWRFEPARLEGRPVAASFRLTLKFSLR